MLSVLSCSGIGLAPVHCYLDSTVLGFCAFCKMPGDFEPLIIGGIVPYVGFGPI